MDGQNPRLNIVDVLKPVDEDEEEEDEEVVQDDDDDNNNQISSKERDGWVSVENVTKAAL